jgi:hypothetical protein
MHSCAILGTSESIYMEQIEEDLGLRGLIRELAAEQEDEARQSG